MILCDSSGLWLFFLYLFSLSATLLIMRIERAKKYRKEIRMLRKLLELRREE